MTNIWIVNQFSNTPKDAGHTRQYEIAEGLVNNGFNVSIFASDFSLSKRKNLKLKKFQISCYEKINSINWYWLKTYPYKKNNFKR